MDVDRVETARGNLHANLAGAAVVDARSKRAMSFSGRAAQGWNEALFNTTPRTRSSVLSMILAGTNDVPSPTEISTGTPRGRSVGRSKSRS